MLANLPQLIISICYLRFNEILTRIFVTKEWVAMSKDYTPLRVTAPQGQQVSSYTLQLPMLWAVWPIFHGILLHFLVSNALFVTISDGGKLYELQSSTLD
jgi:hypothetical protein